METQTQKTEWQTNEVDLELKGTAKDEFRLLNNTASRLDSSYGRAGETESLDYLKGPLSDVEQPSNQQEDVFIGKDALTAMTSLEIRRCMLGDPFTARTRLGWAINDPWAMNLTSCTVRYRAGDVRQENYRIAVIGVTTGGTCP